MLNVFLLSGVLFLKAYSADPQLPSSPCYSSNLKEQMQQREMLKQMRDMRPGANAQIQNYAKSQANQQMTDWQGKANALMAPYLSRAYQLQSQASSCRSESCASAIANQASSLSNDLINNVLPQVQAMARAAQQDMADTTKMPIGRLDEMSQANSGQPLASSRSQLYFPPLCTGFQPQSAAHSFFEWHKLQKQSANLGIKSIRDWNDKNATGLGEWACVGSLAMGNVRCFKREEDPKGNGQSCEKINGQIAACYDTAALWSPISSSKSKDDANWASWFDRPPKVLRVMAGALIIEEQETKKVIEEKTKEAQEMKLVAPLLRPQESNPAQKPLTEPPVPRWENWENKILSGKGLSIDDINLMTEGDKLRLRLLQDEILKKSNKAGLQDVLEQGAAKADQKIDEAAQWTKRNEENIQSTVELVENIAFISGPLAPAVSGGLELTAKTATVVSRMMVLRAEDSTPKQYALELVLLLGPDQIKKLGSQGLKATTELAGFTPEVSAQIVDNANTIADLMDKSKLLEGKK